MLSPSTKPAPPRNTRKPPFLKQGRRLAYRLRFTIYFGRLVPLIAPARKKPALSRFRNKTSHLDKAQVLGWSRVCVPDAIPPLRDSYNCAPAILSNSYAMGDR